MTPQDQTVMTGLRAKRDGDLIRLYTQRGSEEAFAELRRRYARLVYSTCLRETGDPTQAEDAAQGVFLLLSRKAHSLERRDTLADWLYAAARHVSRNLRKQERRRQMNEARALRDAPTAQRETVPDPLWERVELHLDAALGRLKPADRQAILLRFGQQQSLAEVGAGLGITENAARMRVQRALEKMRAHLGRVGVALPLILLDTLLRERSAPALPPALLNRLAARAGALPPGRAVSLGSAVRRASLRLSFLASLKLLSVLVVVAGIAASYSQVLPRLSPQPLSPSERQRAFQELNGAWRGGLEYADDRSGQHFTYPTTVTVRSFGAGSSLSLVATYLGSPAVDRTTFAPGPRAGTFSVTSGGPQSSHALAGVGEWVRVRGGGFAFQGKNAARAGEVRVRFLLGAKTLTIEEEYRLMPQEEYRFRNRFSLHRQ